MGLQNCVGPALRASVSFAILLSAATAQQPPQRPAQQPAASPAPAQTQPAPSSDLAAQEDALIKRCNEQLNVKGQFKEAEETAKQALELSQKMGDKNRIMVAQMYLGSAYAYQGRQFEALEIFQRTADLAREIGNRKGLSRALNNIAGVLGNLGRFEECLRYLNQCLDVARELGDLPIQYTVTANIGRLYLASGDPDKAEAPLQDSLRLARQLKHSDLVSNPSKVAAEASLVLLGEMETEREHYQPALQYYQEVRDSHPDNPQVVIDVLQDMAFVQQRLGAPQKSLELLQEAMPMAEKQGSASFPRLLGGLGESQESLGKLDEALASENQALAVDRQTGGSPDYDWQVEREIGHIHRSLGHHAEALAHYQNSIHQVEQLRTATLNTEPGRAGLGGRSRNVYAEAADLLLDMGREPEALETAERGRARAFLDMLAQSRSGLPDELTPEQKQREDAILARVSATQKELWKENLKSEEEKKYKAELSIAENDLEAFHVEVRQANPRYASIHYPEPINVRMIQKNLLDRHTVLAEFLLGEKRSLLWVVSSQKVSVAVLPPRKEIEDEVTAYRKALTEKISALTLQGALAEIERRGKHLYASLLQPAENAIPPGSTLIIVPDGNLGYLPFESLVVGALHGAPGEVRPLYLLDKFAITYGPSASSLAVVREMNAGRQERPKTLLAFGDPVTQTDASLVKSAPATGVTRSSGSEPEGNAGEPASPATQAPAVASSGAISDEYTERGFSLTRLPYTRDEVLGISNLYPAAQRQVYLGEEAREETVKSEKLDAYRYIHFASHGFVDESHPGRSGILFSRAPNSTEDGVLQMGEIMRLKLNADLVTLSACSTGLGKLVNGEGILGLTRAFFYAGARNVTVSLWNVNDSATATLMKAYYQNLNHGLPNSAALRQAKLSLLRGSNPSWRHPYFWAPFVLVGEGK